MDPSSAERIVGIDADDNSLRGDISARSSNLPRTLISSSAFIKELYPEEFIPTLVYDRKENDWIIRGYSLCPKLNQKFDEFLKSADFENKRKEKPEGKETNEEFVVRLSKNFDEVNNTFSNVWNVYDRYLIIQNNFSGRGGPPGGGGGPPGGSDGPPSTADVEKLSTEDFERLKDLADWYETSKYVFATHNIHVAGHLLRIIMRNARAMIHTTDDRRPQRRRRIYEFSAHYPTLLSLFASLRAENSVRKEPPADKIPGFGAALIFELYRNEKSRDYFMKLKWWEGDGSGSDNDVNFVNIAIGREPCTDAEKGCKFSDMDRILATDTGDDWDRNAFCTDCESSIDVCRAETDTTLSGTCETSTKVAAGSVGVVAGLVLGILLALGYLTIKARRKRRGLSRVEDPFDAEGDFNGDVGA